MIALGPSEARASVRVMRPHPRTRPRHRSSRRASRTFSRLAQIAFTLLGTFALAGLCLLSAEGRIVLAIILGFAALFALGTLGCVAGRAAASVHNSLALQTARTKLERLMHENHASRHAREFAPRHFA